MKYLKRLDLVIGLDFHSNFVVTLVTNFTLDQQKRESFDDPEFLNKSFQLALSKKKNFLQQILQLQYSPFQNLITVLNDARFSAHFLR